jgi:DNA invertase Pin-like site-specific DNA recombinase
VVEYVDRARSGSTIAGRPELLRLRADALAGHLDVVVVHKMDRLSRDLADGAALIRDLEEAAVQVWSASEGRDPTTRGIHLVMGETYRRQLSERTRAGVLKAAEAGRIGGPAPYGYRRNAEGQLEVNPDQAPIARRLFSDFLHGSSMKGLARTLNTEGIPSPSGGEWRASSLLSIFGNEVYRGRLVFARRTFRRNHQTGRRVYRKLPRAQWLVVERPDLALVDDATWQAVQERRSRRRSKGGECHRTYSLSGVVHCAECGAAFVAQASTNRKGRYVYMTCGSRATGGMCNNSFRFRTDLVEPALLHQLADVLFTAEAKDVLAQAVLRLAAEHLAKKDAALEAVEAQKADIRLQMEPVMRLMKEAAARGDRTDRLWAAELARLNASLEALEEHERELTIGPRLDLGLLSQLVQGAVSRKQDEFARMTDPAEIRESLRVLVGRIEAHPDGRLVYSTTPVSLLEAEPALRSTLVAGARFVLLKKCQARPLLLGAERPGPAGKCRGDA